MNDRFDFEQQIQKCWMITDDIADIAEGILEQDLDKDQIVNALTGMGQIYELRFNKLWDQFESVFMALVRENKMLNEECAALRSQLYDAEFSKYGTGSSGAGTNHVSGGAGRPSLFGVDVDGFEIKKVKK
jgi:regulator of replication initiation timing